VPGKRFRLPDPFQPPPRIQNAYRPAPYLGQNLPETIIELDSVKLSLPSAAGPVNILKGIDLKIARGETAGLVGPSGSGKSTLLMVLAGLERPSTGRVSCAGAEFTRLGEDELARFRRDHIGIVFQSFHLIPTMTALENVAIPLEFAGRADAFDRAAEELKLVGLGHRLTHYPGQLSGGEQQRVALARAVAGDPEILLADEPTGNLDQSTGHEIIELMFDLHARKNATLVLITHDEALAARCHRIVRLRDGLVEKIESGTLA
jgi:putative ABC transport system ATP-binding protein